MDIGLELLYSNMKEHNCFMGSYCESSFDLGRNFYSQRDFAISHPLGNK